MRRKRKRRRRRKRGRGREGGGNNKATAYDTDSLTIDDIRHTKIINDAR